MSGDEAYPDLSTNWFSLQVGGGAGGGGQAGRGRAGGWMEGEQSSVPSAAAAPSHAKPRPLMPLAPPPPPLHPPPPWPAPCAVHPARAHHLHLLGQRRLWRPEPRRVQPHQPGHHDRAVHQPRV